MMNNQSAGQPINLTVNPRLDAALQVGWDSWEETARTIGVQGVLVWLGARLELTPDGADLVSLLTDLLVGTDPEERTISRIELAELLQGEDDPVSETLWEGVLAYGLESSEADYIFEASSHLAAIAEEYADPLAAAEYFIDFLNWRRQPDHHSESEQVEVAFDEIIRLAETDGNQRAAAIFANRQAQFTRLEETDEERASAGDWESNPELYRSWE